ncbi:Rid family detoxifying hydrolase, partial [Nostoc cycadae]|uniref:Rid family detoxifying hydrolase n=1 Tax=Nostoc cycadae TaxID=246795 RepID=UPI000CCC25B1
VNFSTDLLNANLSKADCTGVNFTQVKFFDTNLYGANLHKAKLQGVTFDKCDLSEVNLAEADLVRVFLGQINLKKACLQKANLERACLVNANLTRANFNGANLRKADLTGANIYGATFIDADLTGAIMPDGEIYKPIASEVEVGKQVVSLEKVISMTRQVINTDQAPAPVGPYNQAIAASGQMIFVAGQIAIDPRLGDVVYTDDVKKQTEQVLANLEAILKAAGATFANVVKTTVFLADMNDFAAVNAVYAKYFPEDTAPARACVQVSRLPKDVMVEIDCIAVI